MSISLGARRNNRSGRWHFALVTALATGLVATSGGADTGPSASAAFTHWGRAWGPGDSTTIRFTQPGLPSWEAAVVYPGRLPYGNGVIAVER